MIADLVSLPYTISTVRYLPSTMSGVIMNVPSSDHETGIPASFRMGFELSDKPDVVLVTVMESGAISPSDPYPNCAADSVKESESCSTSFRMMAVSVAYVTFSEYAETSTSEAASSSRSDAGIVPFPSVTAMSTVPALTFGG